MLAILDQEQILKFATLLIFIIQNDCDIKHLKDTTYSSFTNISIDEAETKTLKCNSALYFIMKISCKLYVTIDFCKVI